MPAADPHDRALLARVAIYTRWANTDANGRIEATAKARKAFADSFTKQVDPDGTLDPAERERRAEAARKAHYTRLALKSAQARRARVAARRNGGAK